jgi:uncharacterized protein (TIGR02271 family)
MQQMNTPIEIGWNVYDRDGEKIGSISEVGPNYLLVQKGMIFVRDIYVPMTAVTNTNPAEEAIQISVGKDEIDDQGWDAPPVWVAPPSTASAGQDDDGLPEDLSIFRGTDQAAGGEAVRVPVHREELRATTVPHTSEAQVRRDVVEERQAIDVPVTHEEIDVRRTPVDRPATAEEATFSGGTIRVPLREDQVVVDKQARVVEEVEVGRRPVTHTQRVEDTVRREEVTVDHAPSTQNPGAREPELAGAGIGADRFQGAGDWDRPARDGDGRAGDEHHEVAGGVFGAVAGAAAGTAVGGPVGAVVGGVAGAAGGAAIGDATEDDVDDLEEDRRDTTTLY